MSFLACGGGARDGGGGRLYHGGRYSFVAGRERGSQVEDGYGMCCRICTGGEQVRVQLCCNTFLTYPIVLCNEGVSGMQRSKDRVPFVKGAVAPPDFAYSYLPIPGTGILPATATLIKVASAGTRSG